MGEIWEKANEWETTWWGDCSNTANEESKQLYYAEQMGISNFDLCGKSVLDIGGGPVSLLLRCKNRGRSVVVDPANYPIWIAERYKTVNIEYIKQLAEDVELDYTFDEVWIYNVLQHVLNPEKVIQIAKRLGKTVRIFEWIDAEINIGHPHSLTQEFLEKQFEVKGKVIKVPWGSEKAWVGCKIGKEDKNMRMHLLGLAHTKTTKEFVACAYTQKVYKLARMLTEMGHEVIHYGADGSDVPCEHVTVINDDVWKQAYGSYDWHKEFFKHDPNDLAYSTFNINAVKEINTRKKDGDFLLISFGNYQKPIADAVQIPFTVEMGIGYSGVFTKYRIFESYAWMHYIYGLLKQGDGSWYDAVIPNYFDPNDFKFSEEKDNYYLYMGRLISRKGVNVAAQVCERLQVPLILAGQGDLKDLEIKPSKYIEHVGTVGVERRAELMSRAKALFAPTYYFEPFGGVTIEANFCGTPAITTDWGVFTETIQHGINGYRCRSFSDFLWAAENVSSLSPTKIRRYADENYSTERIKEMYQHYFEHVYDIRDKGWYQERKNHNLEWLRRY